MVHVEPSDSTIFELFDPFCRLEYPVTQGNEEVGDSPFVFDVSVGGAFEYVLVVFDLIVESGDLFLEVTDFDVLVGVVSGNGGEEPFGDGSEDVGVKIGVCCQCGHNGIGRHRWFRTLEWMDRERDAVLDGRGVGGIGRSI